MTVCIAARQGTRWILGADTYCSDDSLLFPNGRSKWHQSGSLWVAGAGCLHLIQEVTSGEFEDVPDLAAKIRYLEVEEDAEFLVLDGDALWHIEGKGGGHLRLDTPMWAIGSGAPMALGYLSAVRDAAHQEACYCAQAVRDCLVATAELCPHVRAPFDIRMV